MDGVGVRDLDVPFATEGQAYWEEASLGILSKVQSWQGPQLPKQLLVPKLFPLYW